MDIVETVRTELRAAADTFSIGKSERGNDILCAAVSTLVQTAYLAISDIAGEVKYTRDKKSAKFEFEVPDGEHNHDADVILRAMRIGLQDLSSGYPQNLKLEET